MHEPENVRVQETRTPADEPEDLATLETAPARPPSPDSPSPAARPAVPPGPADDRSRPRELGRKLGPGHRVAKYEVIRELGRGGMGVVYLARDTRLGRLVALKFLHIEIAGSSAHFLVEARTTAQCNHENIVVLHEADEHQGQPYMVLEYLQGKALDELLEEQRKSRAIDSDGLLPPARVVQLITPVLRALERAHYLGIVHRDLKPSNVMLTESGTVKVLDFGVAQSLVGESDSLAGQPAGTLPYMSPEQISGQTVDERSDIWAVGIMMWEMVTGRHPLAPVTLKQLQGLRDLDTPMPRLGESHPELGPLGVIIDRCLLKHLDDRIGSASELLRELEPLSPSGKGLALGADHSPFIGLSAFQPGDADRFFGRASDIVNLVARVRQQPLTAVVGSSGVGKSSLVRAGVLPALERSGEGWQSVVIRPGRTPMTALVSVLEQVLLRVTDRSLFRRASSHSLRDSAKDASNAPQAGARGQTAETAEADLDDIFEVETLTRRLRVEPGYLGAELRAWAQPKLRRLVIFVDQFEEIYTSLDDPEERAAFLTCLASVADDASSPLRVILSMRADFLERMAEDRAFMAVATQGLVFLPPMSRVGLRDALEKPLEVVGYRFERPDMVTDMLDELESTPGALPLMQFTASQLWDARDREHKLLTEASYRDLGGIAGTLAGHADHVLASMSQGQVKLARAIFERLVTPERTRAIVSLGEIISLPGESRDIEDVLQTLADARLVVVESGATLSAPASDMRGNVEIVHESLIARWPTLRRWLDENHGDAEFLARLRNAARQWEKSGRDPGTLWRSEPAAEARRWWRGFAGELPDSEQRFLKAVFAHADRSRRRKRLLIYAGVAALALLVLVGAIAVTKAQNESQLKSQRDQLAAQRDQLEAQRDQLQHQQAELERSLADEKRARQIASEAEALARASAQEAQEARARVTGLLEETERQRNEAVVAREEAVARATEAEQARAQAEVARREAEAQKRAADEARKLVERQKRRIQKLLEKQGVNKVDL